MLPPDIGHHEGFSESVYLVKRLAENLGVTVEGIAVGARPPPRKFEQLLGLVEPEMEIPVTAVDGWDELWERLGDAEEDDLVVPLKVRKGGVGWSPELNRLSRGLAETPPESFVVVTPRQGEPGYAAQFFRLD